MSLGSKALFETSCCVFRARPNPDFSQIDEVLLKDSGNQNKKAFRARLVNYSMCIYTLPIKRQI